MVVPLLLTLTVAGNVYTGVPSPSARPEEGALMMHTPLGVTYRLGGPMGRRVTANVENWLLPAIDANPRILEMFRMRDREPVPEMMPWAGEFIGKYLISAVQACRMTNDPRLREHVRATIHEFIGTQADDGYLGPWPRFERLLGHWDLWGHYHAVEALLMWYEDTGDEAALKAATRAGDLVCNTFLQTGRRVYDAGSYEMNMSIITALGWLYRETPNPRYLAMMRELEADWQRPGAGDYFRAGEAGIDFHRTPKPRWESLHDLQGLVELYRITGEEAYRKAFVNHWTSIATHDRHPTGAYSTGEQSVGNPYSLGAIETCCTTAWMALTLDMLRLTGDSWAADELELTTWNSMLGSQHPSGRWWTYNTPVDGVREASAHTIVFQSRYGTPELNCCSVNAPRGLGILSEWGVLSDDEGIVLNYYGPCTVEVPHPTLGRIRLTQTTDYPVGGAVRLAVDPERAGEFTLKLRVPAWSTHTQIAVDRRPCDGVVPGTYFEVRRRWQPGDTVEIGLDMALRYWAGEMGRMGHAAIYRGPLMLAFDPKLNSIDSSHLPAIDLARLGSAEVRPDYAPVAAADARFAPTLLVRVPAVDGTSLLLCDFASAGVYGTDYVGWLPAMNAKPAPFYLRRPRADGTVPAGRVLFEWTGYGRSSSMREFRLTVARDAAFRDVVLDEGGIREPKLISTAPLPERTSLYWRVVASNAYGETECFRPIGPFTLDPSLENTIPEQPAASPLGPGELMVSSSLDGDGTPGFGLLVDQRGVSPAPDRHGRPNGAVRFAGTESMIRYRVPPWPEEECTFVTWVQPEGLPTTWLHQVFSAWCRGMDDPLRVCIQGDALYARIEAGGGYGTDGVPLRNGEWVHVAVVRAGQELTLYVNGQPRARCPVLPLLFSAAEQVALGGNPLYTGANECFIGCIDDFALYARAWTPDEVRGAYEKGQ